MVPAMTHTTTSGCWVRLDIFDFELSAGEMQTLARMDKGQPMIGNPQNPALVEMSAGW